MESDRLVLDCFVDSRQLFLNEVEGGMAVVLKNYVKFLDVLKYHGHLNAIHNNNRANKVTLEYKLDFQIKFEVCIEGSVFRGLLNAASLTSSNIADLSGVTIEWTNNKPSGYFYQQADSLIRSTKTKYLLIQTVQKFEAACIDTFGRRFLWTAEPNTEGHYSGKPGRLRGRLSTRGGSSSVGSVRSAGSTRSNRIHPQSTSTPVGRARTSTQDSSDSSIGSVSSPVGGGHHAPTGGSLGVGGRIVEGDDETEPSEAADVSHLLMPPLHESGNRSPQPQLSESLFADGDEDNSRTPRRGGEMPGGNSDSMTPTRGESEGGESSWFRSPVMWISPAKPKIATTT